MRKMKITSEQWLRELPVSWGLSRIASLYTLRNTKVSDKDYMPLSVTMNGIVPQLETAAKTNAHDDRKLVKKGDFAINSRSDRRGSCGISEYDGSVSLINTILAPLGEMNPNYYNWLFHTTQFADEFYKWGHGIVDDLWTTGWQDMKKIMIPVPPLQEQKKIATFLDAKCAEIDALTADIQTQIDTLEQYKRSVITETVTKGRNPDAEMKDSGIDGAGVTPSHWKTTRLCYECYIRARLGWRGLKADEYVDEGYAFISAFNIQNGKLVWTPLNYITKERFDESPEIKLHSGDVLIVKDGAGVGKCARVDDLPMGGTAPNSSIAVITPSKNLDYRYVCYYLQSAVFNNFVLLLYNGMGVPHLTQEVMSKIKILVPPLKEQMVISDYLDAKCTEIDAVVETKKSQLATLDEYKKSLIFEYVTGKKEVPAV